MSLEHKTNKKENFNEKAQNETSDRNANLFSRIIDIFRRGVGWRSYVSLLFRERRQYHATTSANRRKGRGGEQGFPRGARHRHTELRLPAFGFRRRLDVVYAAGHVV